MCIFQQYWHLDFFLVMIYIQYQKLFSRNKSKPIRFTELQWNYNLSIFRSVIFTKRLCDEEYTSLFLMPDGLSSTTSRLGPVTVALWEVSTRSEQRPPDPTVWILNPWYRCVSTFLTMVLAMWGLFACWWRWPST